MSTSVFELIKFIIYFPLRNQFGFYILRNLIFCCITTNTNIKLPTAKQKKKRICNTDYFIVNLMAKPKPT